MFVALLKHVAAPVGQPSAGSARGPEVEMKHLLSATFRICQLRIRTFLVLLSVWVVGLQWYLQERRDKQAEH
jgi:hypothetical protein